jgi:uncharacterized membrane protein
MSPAPAPTKERAARRLPRLIRIVRARRRLFIAVAVGGVVAVFAWLTGWRPAASFLLGWDVCVALYLILAFESMARSDVGRIRERAAEQDEGQVAILIGTVSAALASLAAILVTFASPAPSGAWARVPPVTAGLAIFLSWAFIHTIFALHYAHEFYDPDGGGGLAFPGGGQEPDYWDFIYFSFVIGMTSQVSDVGVTTKTVRRTVTAHGVVSFAFNTALLALSINLAASALPPR